MKVLIVIDAQYDFTYGSLRNEEAIQAIPNINQLIDYASNHDILVICTQDTHFNNYDDTQEGHNLPIRHCQYGTKGHELVINNSNEISSIHKNAFGYLHWDEILGHRINEIILCGFCTDICVMANFQILKAIYPETVITVINDACAGVTPELHEAAINVMRSCQAVIKTTEEIIND